MGLQMIPFCQDLWKITGTVNTDFNLFLRTFTFQSQRKYSMDMDKFAVLPICYGVKEGRETLGTGKWPQCHKYTQSLKITSLFSCACWCFQGFGGSCMEFVPSFLCLFRWGSKASVVLPWHCYYTKIKSFPLICLLDVIQCGPFSACSCVSCLGPCNPQSAMAATQ